VGVLEDGPGGDRSLVPASATVKHAFLHEPRFLVGALWATKPIGPPQLIKVVMASLFCSESLFKFESSFGKVVHASILYLVVTVVKWIARIY
jgi:hypothetical protein